MDQALAPGPMVPTELRKLNQFGNFWVSEGKGRMCEDLDLVKDMNVRAKCALRCYPFCQARPPNQFYPVTQKYILPISRTHPIILFSHWLLRIYFPLGARHMVTGCQEGLYVVWIVKNGVLSTSFLVFCYFDMKELNCFCLLHTACLVSHERHRGSDKPSAS